MMQSGYKMSMCVCRAARRCANAAPLSRGFRTTSLALSGHNKWSTIKHDKMKNDSARNKVINKYVGQITVAAKLRDPRLQSLIDSAMRDNVPKKVIDNALQKAAGSGEAEGSTNIYEGMGPGGVAVVVEAQTDNRNRTVALVRAQFTKAGHNLLPMGGCMHYFDRVGRVLVAAGPDIDVFDVLLGIDGVTDFSEVQEDDGAAEGAIAESQDEESSPQLYTVLTAPAQTNSVALAIQDAGLEVRDTAIGYEPKASTAVDLAAAPLADTRTALHRLVAALEATDDVTAVYTNEATN